VIGVSGLVLTDDEAALLARFRPAGAILFRRNVGNPDQLRALTASLRSALPEGAVIMVDQEGGRVARLRPPHWHAHPPASGIGALYDTDPAAGLRAAWLTGALIGLDCAAAGFDTVCAPVLDLRHPGASDVVGDRSFGANPESVAALGAQVAAGLLAAGMQPVMKHLPGHGRALVDSHLSLPEVEGILPEELAPFIANHALPWAMTAHVVYRGHDRLPATLSPALVAEVIRGRIGFAGVLCSDDLAMHALSGPPETRALAALAAGCDLALYCGGEPAANAAVLSACPPLTAAAQARLASSRALAHISAAALDARELAAERDVLIR
jgi:beta-N-acetylhexosaminidase